MVSNIFLDFDLYLMRTLVVLGGSLGKFHKEFLAQIIWLKFCIARLPSQLYLLKEAILAVSLFSFDIPRHVGSSYTPWRNRRIYMQLLYLQVLRVTWRIDDNHRSAYHIHLISYRVPQAIHTNFSQPIDNCRTNTVLMELFLFALDFLKDQDVKSCRLSLMYHLRLITRSILLNCQ